MTRSATIYRRTTKLLLHPSSKTTAGVWILSEPCLAVATDCDDRELGAAIRSVLDSSRTGVAHPDQSEWKGMFDPMLRLAGVKSWKTFASNASMVHVSSDGEQVTITPYAIKRGRHGFPPDRSRTATLHAPSHDDLGRTSRALL